MLDIFKRGHGVIDPLFCQNDPIFSGLNGPHLILHECKNIVSQIACILNLHFFSLDSQNVRNYKGLYCS